ncbi:MAG: thiamine pyrophosphate-binding protein, partial [Acidimicrobiia bacterium]
MNASKLIIESLAGMGIDAIFGLPGVHALGLFNAVASSTMRYYGFRHEQAAAHAADGYGRATGKPGVVLLSTGPGALNALSALGEAYVCSSPVLAISSHIPSNLVGKGKGYLHESKDLGPAFSSVSAFHARAKTAEEIPDLLADALIACTGGRPRPAFLEIPTDFLDSEVDQAPFAISPIPRGISPDEIEHAAFLLGLSARPVIWAGGGVNRSRAWEELRKVAEILDAPVLTTFMGKGSISEDHPLAVGTMVRQPETADLLGNADLMLAVGTRFTGMSTGNWKLSLPPQLIHIDIDVAEIGRNYPIRHGVKADAKHALAALAKALEGRQLAT